MSDDAATARRRDSERLERDEKTVELADAYRDACRRVQPAWLAVLAAYPGRPERVAYLEAREAALDARDALLKHALAGASEVGT